MSIWPKNILFNQRPCLFDQKLCYSTKGRVYLTKNYSIWPKAVSIRPKNILFDQKPFLFDQKIFYSTKSCVYSTKNCSIRPKAVSIRPKIHSFDQKPSSWPLMNALQKVLLCFKKASNFKTTKGHVNASHYMFSLHFHKGEETKYRFSELNCLFNYLINISLKIKQKQFNCIGMMQAMIKSEYGW